MVPASLFVAHVFVSDFLDVFGGIIMAVLVSSLRILMLVTLNVLLVEVEGEFSDAAHSNLIA